MRCLYCGKQLALLKRLTGGGESCSDAHKQSYQEEYNRLALSRLLQAQSKPGEIKTTAPKAPTPAEGLGQPLPPGASRRRALPSSAPAPEPARGRVFHQPAASAPVAMEEPVLEVAEEPPPAMLEEAPVETVLEAPVESEEAVPPEVTVFSMEIPAYLAPAEETTTYVEPWSEVVSAPASPALQLASQAPALSSIGNLLALQAAPSAGEMEFRTVSTELAPLEFARAEVSLNALAERPLTGAAQSQSAAELEYQLFSSIPTASLAPLEFCSAVSGNALQVLDVAGAHAEFTSGKASLHVPFNVEALPLRAFPAASPIDINIRVTSSGVSHQSSSSGALRFPVRIAFQDSALLNLYPSGIDFPAEDSDVVLIDPWAHETSTDPNGLAPEPGASPREALQALSKLHQDLVQEQDTQERKATPPLEEPAVEPDVELISEPQQPGSLAAAPEEPAATTIDISPEPMEERAVPGSAHDLFEIAVKTFTPAKPALAVEATALVNLMPEMPRLKALPLRPKMAKTPPGFSPQTAAAETTSPAEEPKPKASVPAAAPPRPEAKTTRVSVPAAKQSTPPVKAPPTVQPVKPGQPIKPVQPVKPVPPGKPPQSVKPAQPASTAKTAAPASQPGKTSTDKSTPEKTAPTKAAPPAEPAAGQSKDPVPSPVSAPKDASAAPAEENMPSFASIQSKSTSLMGSMKGKLVIAICLVVTAGGVFLGWNSKSHKAAASPAPAAEEGVGPSIMLGEGGWEQGWAGDTNGSHAGRQITIYRPSLKLTNYRIEFQGEIENKSVGWVFRAMDPYNYYAMKLAIVTPGLAPKMALIKYTVVQGHETEVGRVPVDIAAHN